MVNKLNITSFPQVFFLLGPTAAGKTTLAIKLRKALPIELISVDSALIYKGMNIGTAKPNEEELRQAPHHLVNILDPSQIYSVADFYRDALRKIAIIISKGKIPFLVGGTMLYFKALLEGLSPLPSTDLKIREKIKQQAKKIGWKKIYQQLFEIDSISAQRIHPNDFQRLSRALEVFFISGKTLTELIQPSRNNFPYQVYQFAITTENRETLHRRIENRFYKMLSLGLEKEVRNLFSRGDLSLDLPSIRCIKYRQMWSYIEGKISYKEMIYKSIHATRQLAKHQTTWLRKWKNLHWLDSEKPQQAYEKVFQAIYNIINYRVYDRR